jgi:diguanylate cyclase (GGDEF)-like protein/PAS domain S-box-containing protein
MLDRITVSGAVIRAMDVFNSHDESNFGHVMTHALEIIAEAARLDFIAIFHYTEMGNEMRLKRLFRWKREKNGGLDSDADYLPQHPAVNGWNEQLQQNIPVNNCRSRMTAEEKEIMDMYAVKSVFISPVLLTGEYWGCVFFGNLTDEIVFDKDYADLYNAAARMVVNAVKHAQISRSMEETFHFLKRRKEQNDLLIKIATLFLSQQESTFNEMMEEGIRPVVDMLHIDIISIWQNTNEPDGLHMSQIYRWDREAGKSTPTSGFSNLSYAEYAPTWESLFKYTNAINGPARTISDPIAAMILKSFGAVSLFATPVFINKKLWGFVLFADTHSERYFDNDNAEMMRVAAFLFANAVIHHEKECAIFDERVRTELMLDTHPMATCLWDGEFNIIDCNTAAVKLFGLNNKQEFMSHFYELSPKYQHNGLLSWEKAIVHIQKAFREGREEFEWAHQLPDGSPLPVEVILERVQYKNAPIIVGYIMDLRALMEMQKKINNLTFEADRVFYDPLTDLYNRRFVDEQMPRMIKSLVRSESQFSLMMVDIDLFKQFNDNYGHSIGDICLVLVAGVLANNVERGDDFVARFGGEEFLVVLPHTNEKGAVKIAEIILKNVRKLDIPTNREDVTTKVTVSIGVACGLAQPDLTTMDYIKIADKQLYQSKQNGRDRFTVTRF